MKKCESREAQQATRTRILVSKRQMLKKKGKQFRSVQNDVQVHVMMPRICASST